jgi:hypothetical protein
MPGLIRSRDNPVKFYIQAMLLAIPISTTGCSSENTPNPLLGHWCNQSLESYQDGRYQIMQESSSWDVEFNDSGEMIESVILGYSFRNGELVVRDSGNLKLGAYEVIEASSNKVVLKETYIIDFDVIEGEESYSLLTRGRCQS